MSQQIFKNIAVAAISVLLSTSYGCPGGHSTDNARPAVNVIAVDRSGSTQHMRQAQIDTVRAAYARASDFGEDVSIYVVDQQASCVVASSPALANGEVSKAVIAELETPPGGRSSKTRPAKFWQQMMKDYSSDPSGPRVVRILYLTDGDNDWFGEGPAVEAAARGLSANPYVVIAIAGLDKDNFEAARSQFTSFGDKRAFCRPGYDKATMIQALTALRDADSGVR